jgi:hypothetical protein
LLPPDKFPIDNLICYVQAGWQSIENGNKPWAM